MDYQLQQDLQRQRLAQGNTANQSAVDSKSGTFRILNFQIPINEWAQLLPVNPSRKFLYIQNQGGQNGFCQADISLDTQNVNALFEVNDFVPRVIPTNAIFVRVSDPLATGSTTVTIQVMEG
jgi:hypothetical protein